ncbi:uncharacterized protein CC84DRAFT_1216664 [Paraphaeosphaeria sporulosa]|uniref:Uncharacterized protein n=1 Tax=Paraphaeosphaeria sporulosa TaxID=1460663 RepID=A0A177CLV3_9PLEO|nr:uncharacterized protein CC84DRAFT_1216664 [Paraphaeosphaeria sporulosa]OAG07757.1 hypothetical protein CC84DRAFT_1216664 [Paraphaeosphaeria sporulosa]
MLSSAVTGRLYVDKDLYKTRDKLEHEMRLEILRQTTRAFRANFYAMHASLPFELRDMVYNHMVKDSEGQISDRTFQVSFLEVVDRTAVFSRFVSDLTMPVLPWPKRLESYTTSRATHTPTVTKTAHLHNILQIDYLHLGLNPVKHLRSLTVHCSLDFILTLSPAQRIWFWSKYSSHGFHMYRTQLEALRHLDLKNGFRLRFDTGQTKNKATLDLMQVLRSIYLELISEEMIVEIVGRVQFDGEGECREVTELSHMYVAYDEWAAEETD